MQCCLYRTCVAELTASGSLTTRRLPLPSCGLGCLKASVRAACPSPRLGACFARATLLKCACKHSCISGWLQATVRDTTEARSCDTLR